MISLAARPSAGATRSPTPAKRQFQGPLLGLPSGESAELAERTISWVPSAAAKGGSSSILCNLVGEKGGIYP